MGNIDPMELPSPSDPLDDRYELLHPLGHGGFAVVYRARDLELRRDVAVKILRFDREGAYRPDTRARFERELRALRQLRDERIVELYADGVTADGRLYAVFEFVSGEDLASVLASRGQLPCGVVARILRQMLQALHSAHRVGLLHRDIKPENIIIYARNGDPWAAKLLDFGIARADDDGHPSITRTGELIGTPRYMSPEQLTERALTPASDLYSLGVVAFELLAGHSALQGPTWGDQLERLRAGHRFGADALEEGEGQLYYELIRHLTARDPRERLQSATAALSMLDAIERQAPSQLPRSQAQPDGGGSSTTARFGWKKLALLGVPALAALPFVLDWHDDGPASQASTIVERGPQAVLTPVSDDEAPVPVDGCGALIEPGRHQLRWDDDLGTVGATVYVPRSYDPLIEAPAVVLLHEGQQTPEGILDEVALQSHADRDGVLLVAIAGYATEQPGSRRPWRAEQRETAWRVTTSLRRVLCVDPKRVVAIGHGIGASVAIGLGCNGAVRGVVATASRDLWSGECPQGPVPLLAIDPQQNPLKPATEQGATECASAQVPSSKRYTESLRVLQACGDAELSSGLHKRCVTWRCASAMTMCQVDGGQHWPGYKTDREDECEGQPSTFPYRDVAWRFVLERFASDSDWMGKSQGCGVVPPFRGQGRLADSFLLDDEMPHVYLPHSYDENSLTPMVILFHNEFDGGAKKAIPQSGLAKLAEEEGFVIMAPRGGTDAWTRRDLLERVSEEVAAVRRHVCVNPARVYAVGHGSGGRAAMKYRCHRRELAGVATTAYAPGLSEQACEDPPPIPHFHVATLKNKFTPPDGEPKCLSLREQKLPLHQFEAKMRGHNDCSDEVEVVSEPEHDTTCYEWSCRTPLRSCHVDAGAGWPGSKPREVIFRRCDGTAGTFPIGERLWAFFKRTTAATPKAEP